MMTEATITPEAVIEAETPIAAIPEVTAQATPTVAPIDVTKETFLTVPEVSVFLGCSKSHVYNMVKRKEIPSFRMIKKIVIPLSSLQSFVNQKLALAN
jgi:excisionase family DNA binding protein